MNGTCREEERAVRWQGRKVAVKYVVTLTKVHLVGD